MEGARLHEAGSVPRGPELPGSAGPGVRISCRSEAVPLAAAGSTHVLELDVAFLQTSVHQEFVK